MTSVYRHLTADLMPCFVLLLLNSFLGVQGILDAYRLCVSQVQLYGPTNFAPIILHVAQFAAAAKKENSARVCSSCFESRFFPVLITVHCVLLARVLTVFGNCYLHRAYHA